MIALFYLVKATYWLCSSKIKIVVTVFSLWALALLAGSYIGYRWEVRDLMTGIGIIILISAVITGLIIFIWTGWNSPLIRSKPASEPLPVIECGPVEVAQNYQWSRWPRSFRVSWRPGENFDADSCALSLLYEGGYWMHEIEWDVDFSYLDTYDTPETKWMRTKNLDRFRESEDEV